VVLGPRGTSLRYGRIGLPALLWVASTGRDGAMSYAQPALMIISGAAVAAATARLFPRSGPILSLAPFVAIGLTASFAGGFAEAPAVALTLWGVSLAVRGRAGLAAVIFSAAILTKESSVLALAGTMLWLALRDGRRRAYVLSASLVPVVAWFGYVAARYGHIPPLDPWLGETRGVALPFAGLWQSLTQSGAVAVALAATHAAAAAAVLIWARPSVFRVMLAFGAILLVSTGPYVWGFIGDGIRQASLAETAIVLAVLATIAPDTADPLAVAAAG
jgi:hypothetical protein